VTFDQAFDRAATLAKAVTVEAAPRNWWQRLGLAARDRFQPTADQRVKALEACREVSALHWHNYGTLPTETSLRQRVAKEVAVGPLTWLWIIAMVAQLLVALKNLLNERGETSGGE